MESEFGHGRASAFRCPPVGRRADEPDVPGVRHIEEDRLQDLRALQGAWARSPDRPLEAAGALCQPAARSDRKPDRPPQAREAALGRQEDQGAFDRRLAGDVRVPAKSTIHAVLDRHGLVQRMGKKRNRATGTPLSEGASPNDLWCADYKGEFKLGNQAVLLSAHRHRSCLALPAVVRGLGLNARRAGIYSLRAPLQGARPCQAPSAPTTACPSLHPTLCSTSPSSPSGG